MRAPPVSAADSTSIAFSPVSGFQMTSPACTPSRLSRLGGALRGGDQITHRLLVTGAQQLDRVGLAVHDRLEEDLAVLIGGQVALGPAAHLVQQFGQPRV